MKNKDITVKEVQDKINELTREMNGYLNIFEGR